MIAAVLGGGRSRRFGADKASVRIDGMTLLERVAIACAAAGLPVVVVGRDAPSHWAGPSVRFLRDAIPDQGPLGGLATILAEASAGGGVLALSCDLPLLDGGAVAWLAATADRHPDGDGVVVRTADGIQPLVAVYRPSILPAAQAALAAGQRAMHRLIGAGRFAIIDAPAEIAPRLADADTPEALAAVLGSLKR